MKIGVQIVVMVDMGGVRTRVQAATQTIAAFAAADGAVVTRETLVDDESAVADDDEAIDVTEFVATYARDELFDGLRVHHRYCRHGGNYLHLRGHQRGWHLFAIGHDQA